MYVFFLNYEHIYVIYLYFPKLSSACCIYIKIFSFLPDHEVQVQEGHPEQTHLVSPQKNVE